MPSVQGILETALYVRDLQRSAAFYVQLLGAEIIADSERLIAFNIAGRSVLLLFKEGATGEPFATPGGMIPPHRGAGPTHFAFSIASGDVPAWKQLLDE